MRKKKILHTIFTLFLSLFLVSCSAQKTKTQTSTNNEVSYVSEMKVKEALDYLASDELKGRETGTEGIEKAAVYIEGKFKEFGVQPYFETYRDNFKIGDRNAYNIVGLIEGADPKLKKEYIIIGAHYDHIGIQKAIENDSIANGANDNAAGTTGVLELARYFSKEGKQKRSIIFALFSGEEMGLKGSGHLAKKLESEGLDVYVMLNLEMIGVPMKAKNYQAYITGFENSNLAEKFNSYTNEEVLGFLPQAQQLNLFKRSDNYPFYAELDVPAQTISTFDFSNYPYYHHVKDEVKFLNPGHIAKLIDALIPGISKMLNTSTKEIKLTE